MTTEKRTARITGLLYVLVIICAGFSQGYVRGSLFLPDDPAGTYNAISTQEGLFRLGLVTDLIAFLCDAAISILLYQLLKPVSKTLAMISAAFRLLAHPAIATLNLLNHYMVLEVIGNPEMMATFAEAQREAAVTLLMTAHQYGYLIAGAFFGIHCLLLGILLYRSSLFPKVFGVLLVFAAVGYLMESFGDLLFPGNEGWLALTVGMSAALGEVSLAIYMLVKGVKSQVGMKNYIQKIRSKLGPDKFIHPAARIIVENEEGQVLIIERQDNGQLGIPAGALEEDETIEACIKREVFEETGIRILDLQVIGISSNPAMETVKYGNGDEIQYFTIEFYSNKWQGPIKVQDQTEVKTASFMDATVIEKLPTNERSTFESLVYFRKHQRVLLK